MMELTSFEKVVISARAGSILERGAYMNDEGADKKVDFKTGNILAVSIAQILAGYDAKRYTNMYSAIWFAPVYFDDLPKNESPKLEVNKENNTLWIWGFFEVANFEKMNIDELIAWKVSGYINTLRNNSIEGFDAELLAKDLERRLKKYKFPNDLLKEAA